MRKDKSDNGHSFLSDWNGRDIYSELLALSQLDVKQGGGAEALAELCGFAHAAQIQRCLRRKSETDCLRQQSLSIFALADLIVFSDGQALRVLRLLNSLAGLRTVPKGEAAALMMRGACAVAGVSKDFSELLGGMSEALRDDQNIDADEILAFGLIEAADQLERDALTLKEQFRATVSKAVKAGKGGGDDD